MTPGCWPQSYLAPLGVALVVILPLAAGAQRGGSTPFGFTATRAAEQLRIERGFQRAVSADSIRDFHKFLAAEPHVAGSPRDKLLAEWTAERFTAYGLEEVRITEHHVLLPYPERVSVEMTAPKPWRAAMTEDPVPGRDDTTHPDVGIPHHAFSASGDVTAPVVYAGSGNPADYEWLAARGIDVRNKIVIVRYSVPYSYRGFKAYTAQARGAAGILIFSDPADDGSARGEVYPHGPWGPDSRIQRGAIAYDFLVPGDPLTPGWPSVPGARRIDKSEAISVPAIISAPLSARDAREIMRALDGPETPASWQGGLGLPYRAGPGPATVRLQVQMDDAVRPIWTVTGLIRGTRDPDAQVIAGNHRDAWIFGGVDPSSGSAALMELARTLGDLARRGSRPARSILFASWDAEEFTLASSTEWGEQHADALRRHAVAYLNVDSAASGPHASATAVPSLNRVIVEAAQQVRAPGSRAPLATAWREHHARARGVPAAADGTGLVNNRLGSGSDYTVFLNFLGVPVVDLTFEGPYGVYHSVYDTHDWVARIGDPGFRSHVALVRWWGLIALRLANADVLPFDPVAYAARVTEFVAEGERVAPASADLRGAVTRLQQAAASAAVEMARVLDQGDTSAADALNRRLMGLERAFIDPEGIPGRPWYRHQVFAPKFTYEPQILPALFEAVDRGDTTAVRAAQAQIAAAIDRAAAVLAPR
jgi:N-acetylated-alpha-linked acidic dipeptidase